MNIGVISYLLRHHGVAKAMDILAEIGYESTELDFRHADGLTDYNIQDAVGGARARYICLEHGIVPRAYCVGGLNKDHLPVLRNVFEFATGLGVNVITGVLDPDILPQLDALCQEYGLYYAIENHRGNVFEEAKTMLEAVAPYSMYVGFNPDTGHFASAGHDAVKEVAKLAGRVYHVHFKDMDQHKHLGQGGIDMPGVMAELKKQGFNGLWSIEHYEYKDVPEDVLIDGLTYALNYFKEIDQATS